MLGSFEALVSQGTVDESVKTLLASTRADGSRAYGLDPLIYRAICFGGRDRANRKHTEALGALSLVKDLMDAPYFCISYMYHKKYMYA